MTQLKRSHMVTPSRIQKTKFSAHISQRQLRIIQTIKIWECKTLSSTYQGSTDSQICSNRLAMNDPKIFHRLTTGLNWWMEAALWIWICPATILLWWQLELHSRVWITTSQTWALLSSKLHKVASYSNIVCLTTLRLETSPTGSVNKSRFAVSSNTQQPRPKIKKWWPTASISLRPPGLQLKATI